MKSAKAIGREVKAQRKKTGRSAGGGLHVVVRDNKAGHLSLSKIDPKKLQHGKKVHGCIHHVGGKQRTELTLLRRKRIRSDHARTVDPSTGKCKEHVTNWKRRALKCGSI